MATLTRSSTETLWDVALKAGSPDAIAGLIARYPDANARRTYDTPPAPNVGPAVRIVAEAAEVAPAATHRGLHLQTAWDVALEIGGAAEAIRHLVAQAATGGGAQVVLRPTEIDNRAVRTRMAITKPASRAPQTGEPWITPDGLDWITPDGQSWWTP